MFVYVHPYICCCWFVCLLVFFFFVSFLFFWFIVHHTVESSSDPSVGKLNVESTRQITSLYNRNDEEKSPMSVIQFKTCCLYVRCQLQTVRRDQFHSNYLYGIIFYFGSHTRIILARYRCAARCWYNYLFVISVDDTSNFVKFNFIPIPYHVHLVVESR